MKTPSIPSAETIRAKLAGLSKRQIRRLAELSGVPAPTIDKVRRGETSNPGIETVRRFMPHVSAARREAREA
jgi:transcriptional regulator with XRE-family HTH domain